MQYINRVSVFLAIVATVVLCAVVFLTVQPALAKQPKGTYAVTGSTTCLQSQSGFNANFTPMNPAMGNVAISQTVIGTLTLNDDGTGSRSGTATSIVEPPAGQPTVNANTFSGTFTYEINNDGTIHFLTNSPTTGTFTQGPRTGQTFSVDEIELIGHASQKGDIHVAATGPLGIETITFSNGDEFERVCSRTRTLIEQSKN